MFQVNQLIGLYTLIKRIGRGGFGEVWLAERRTSLLTTEVAIKLPLDEQVDLDTIKQEAGLWKQASGHPNVLSIIEANIYDGQVVIVSEYAPDGSLADLIKLRGIPSVEKAVEIIYGILDGLEFLHSRHIIHRDLKPANILMQGGTPRLADFGISRALKATQTSQSVNVAGTPPYMAPEAFDGKRNVQTDVWSIGVVFYYLLTGRLPFPQQDITSLLGAIFNRNPHPLPESIPQLLKDVVLKALEKSPEQRFKSAAEMQNALWDALKGRAKLPVSIPIIHEDDDAPTVIAKSNPKTTRKSTLASSANVFFVALLVFLFLGGITFLILQELKGRNERVDQSPLPQTMPSNSQPNIKLSPTVSATRTPKSPSQTPTPQEMPYEQNEQKINGNINTLNANTSLDIEQEKPEINNTEKHIDQKMLQAATNRALELRTGSKIESGSFINQGQYNRIYIFLLRGKYLGIRRFRVQIKVRGKIIRQGNTYSFEIIEIQDIENVEI